MNAMSRLYENEDGDTGSCTVLDVAANMKLAIKMFYDITYQNLESAEAKQAFKVLHFEECEGMQSILRAMEQKNIQYWCSSHIHKFSAQRSERCNSV